MKFERTFVLRLETWNRTHCLKLSHTNWLYHDWKCVVGIFLLCTTSFDRHCFHSGFFRPTVIFAFARESQRMEIISIRICHAYIQGSVTQKTQRFSQWWQKERHGAFDREAAPAIMATGPFIFGLDHTTGLKIWHLVSLMAVPPLAGLFKRVVSHSGNVNCVQEGDFCESSVWCLLL